jgi:pyrimidine-nucleoside phosphorylase
MRAVDIITKKRDGGELTEEEIHFFIEGFTRDAIPDYQAAAWAMAVLWRGMTPAETTHLTEAMAQSGDRLDLSAVCPFVVDKHSTGGVGDKTTLVVEPIVAASDVPVGKMSGRGLSFTGGTLDKMESFRGYNVDLTTAQFIDQLKRVGLVLCGQTLDLAPADGKLYALRDVTGTVPSIPLIASSVLSKKIASGADGIVLDVKVGLGAFMPTVEKAEELAHLMVDIGIRAGRRVVALISDMNQPLGHAVGNALEVREALDTLRGEGPADFRQHCLHVAGHMLHIAGKGKTLKEAVQIAGEVLHSGAALGKLRLLVEAQGGDVRMVDEPQLLPQAALVQTVGAPQDGYVAQVHAREVGLAVVALGGGREKKGDPVDHAVGVVIHRKVGDRVKVGEALFTVHANDADRLAEAQARVLAAYRIQSSKVEPLPLFYGTVSR